MRRLIATGVVAVLVVVLGVAQLVLPGIAEQQLRDRLERSGQVLAVSVSAFPAIELLWRRADSVTVRLGRYRSNSGHLASLLADAGDVGTLHASATELDTGLLTLHDATLVKRGSQLAGTAVVTEAAIRRALPILRSVTPVASGDGTLTVRGTASLFGLSASVDATVAARDGKLIVEPDVPLGGLATITVFSNPAVEVQSIGATPTASGFLVHATARLH
jgi:hypothetical protein